MYFDALTLAAVADELHATILGGRVQRVLLTGPLGIGLEVYAQHQRYQLLASAHPQWARVHLVRHKLSRGVEQATPFLLLLRKYVLGGRIIAIEQPALERILVLSIVKEPTLCNHEQEPDARQSASDAHPMGAIRTIVPDDDRSGADHTLTLPVLMTERVAPLLRCELIIEPMERHSNIILVDDNNLILDSIKRVTPRMSQRVILPRQVYEVPPCQQKRDPRMATATDIAATLAETGERMLARALVAAYRGVSPQVAREVIYRGSGTADTAVQAALPWEQLATELRAILSAVWIPTLVPGPEQPQAYAPYALTYLPGATPQPTISVALETFYAPRETVTAHQQRRAAVQQQFAAVRERLQHQHQQLLKELERVRNLEHMRWEGEMIFAFLHTLTPGQSMLEVEGQQITLDPHRNPVEAAQARFRAYEKAKQGLAGIPERCRATEHALAGLEQLTALLDVADTREQIDQIAQEAAEQGYTLSWSTRTQHKRQDRPDHRRRVRRLKPLHLVSSDGLDIYVGRSSEQNAEVTFRIGRPDDLWLHVRTIPGGHVIVRTTGSDVPERTLQEAAGLAAYFSRVRTERAVEVDLAHRRLVRKVPGGPPGLVTYRAERTLRVAPIPPWM